ncbi:2-hydroxychromene-2-carboxylate isomerase [Kiloniella laminariae]|uniref:2-hydroxychromene-2-carboxylate isomerase n=1 Tax=Kiloniella laminariae TaxID=454162 RepID=A0ABT4LHT3_9PROT|nr:2-hydroxychromene-2-carboxylate isomerase [Kiloniella laminariae]MCZ4279567.1 2-hydroxychromene-2-carboxylate isomerase [Kiloniella laminariae]
MPSPIKTIDYYYSTRSNFTYLGAARLNSLAQKYGWRIVHRPILLSVIMPPIGGLPFDARPTMLRNYAMNDALRWAEHLGISLQREPVYHDGPVELPSGIVIAGQRAVNRGEVGNIDLLSLKVVEALWRDDRDIADAAVIEDLCQQAGFVDPKSLISEALSPAVQAELERNCREAIIRGVIGAPTYFVEGENFYGQDRLEFVERALQKQSHAKKTL